MPITQVNRGAMPNDRTGDVLREAFGKINNSLVFLDGAVVAAQTTGNTARTEAAAANTNANSRILTSQRNVANGVANLNGALRLTYSSEILITALGGNAGRVFLAPAGLHNNNASAATGCWVIKLSSVTAMHTVRARAFNYGTVAAGRGVTEFNAGIYHTTGTAAGTWPSICQSQYGSIPLPVYAAIETATGRRCLVVGAVNQQWVFGALQVLDSTSHRSTITGVTGTESVSVEFVTNLDAYTSVTEIPDSGPYATANAALALGQAAYPDRGVMAANTDWNTLTDNGNWIVSSNGNAATMLNSPSTAAGSLKVARGSGFWFAEQTYTEYVPPYRTWKRMATSASAWYAWEQQASFTNAMTSGGFVAASTDLNTLTTPNTYYGISTNAIAATLVNLPTVVAGTLEVIQWATQGYVLQRYTQYATGKQWTRFQTSPTAWGLWTEFPILTSGGVLTIAPTNNTNASLLISSTGSNGASIRLTGDGSTTPSKTIRARAGALEVVNTALTTNILTLTDAGALLVSGTVTSTGAQINGNLAITGTATGITKGMVGLPNVDNTADSAKPVSTAMQTALNAKGGLASSNTWTNPNYYMSEVRLRSNVYLETSNPASEISTPIFMKTGNGFMPHFRSNQTTQAFEWVDSANANVIMRLRNDGTLYPMLRLECSHAQNTHKALIGGYGANQGYGLVFAAGVGGYSAGVLFQTPSGNPIGSISQTDTSVSYNTTSDERLKDKFREFDAYTIMDMVAVYEHEFIAQPGIKHYGVKAAEFQLVLPGAVTGRPGQLNPDGSIDPQQVDYSKGVPLLMRHAQQTAERIRTLEATVATQAAIIDSINARLTALEQ